MLCSCHLCIICLCVTFKSIPRRETGRRGRGRRFIINDRSTVSVVHVIIKAKKKVFFPCPTLVVLFD